MKRELFALVAAAIVAVTGAPAKAAGPPPIVHAAGRPVTLPDGLRYVDVVVGHGARPKAGDNVRVHYSGWLLNGTMFDSSRTRNQPFTFPLGRGQVIPGWDQGVATMRVGGRRRLTIPAKLGYGPGGTPGGPIPPNATLIFDVELLGIDH